MTTTIIHIPVEQVLDRLDHGKLWVRNWGTPADPKRPTCLHGAIMFCAPVPGDAHLIEQVGGRYGFGTADNDAAVDFADVEQMLRSHADLTDDMLADTFGPQWEPIVSLVRRAAILTPDEAQGLDAAWDAARTAAKAAAWDAARAAAWAAARDAAWDAAWTAAKAAAWDAARAAAKAAAWDAARAAAWAAARDAAWDAAWTAAKAAAWDAARAAAWAAAWDAARAAARDAARALVIRDLIGDTFTQAHYDTLTRPWTVVIGPVHPDDAPVTA